MPLIILFNVFVEGSLHNFSFGYFNYLSVKFLKYRPEVYICRAINFNIVFLWLSLQYWIMYILMPFSYDVSGPPSFNAFCWNCLGVMPACLRKKVEK